MRLVVIITPGCHAAGGHAGVAGFNHHRHALGLKMLPDGVGDLRGQPLLHLQPSREAVQHARELADADDVVAGK